MLPGGKKPLAATAVGSVRRGAPFAKDIDVLVRLPAAARGGVAPPGLAGATLRPARRGDRLEVAAVTQNGPRRVALVLRSRGRFYRCDLFGATAAEEPFALFHFTGPAIYNIRIRAFAKRRGWRLNQYGLFSASGHRVRGSAALRSEQELAEFLGITPRGPGERGAHNPRRS